MSEKYLHFKIKACSNQILSQTAEETGSIYFGNIFQILYANLFTQRCVHKRERNWNNSGRIKIDNFPKYVNF